MAEKEVIESQDINPKVIAVLGNREKGYNVKIVVVATEKIDENDKNLGPIYEIESDDIMDVREFIAQKIAETIANIPSAVQIETRRNLIDKLKRDLSNKIREKYMRLFFKIGTKKWYSRDKALFLDFMLDLKEYKWALGQKHYKIVFDITVS